LTKRQSRASSGDEDEDDDVSVPTTVLGGSQNSPQYAKVSEAFFGATKSEDNPYILSNWVALGDFTKLGMVVRQILAHPQAGRSFRQLLGELHAQEASDFLDDLILHVHVMNKTEENTKEAAARLVSTYVSGTAPKMVNLGDSTRRKIMETFESGSFTSVAELLERAMYEVFSDLKQSDSLRQFCVDNEDGKKIRKQVFAVHGSDAARIQCKVTMKVRNFICPEYVDDALKALGGSNEDFKLVKLVLAARAFEGAKDDATRVALGHAAIANFFHPTSDTFVKELSPIYKEEVERGDFETVLQDAKIEALRKLVQNPKLLTVANKRMKLVKKRGV